MSKFNKEMSESTSTFERPRAREANREHPGNDKHPKITLMCHSFKFSQVCASIILCEIKQTEKNNTPSVDNELKQCKKVITHRTTCA